MSENTQHLNSNKLRSLTIKLCEPRGFCAGVDRAIKIVDLALKKYGPPVYVRHAIVHNKYVVNDLAARGAVFVENLDEIPPDQKAPIVFSAHGVSLGVKQAAAKLECEVLDATCPLVSKVHSQAKNLYKSGHRIFLIGHHGHPEVEGTMGQVPPEAAKLIETEQDVAKLEKKDGEKVAFLTQTTLSVSDTSHIIAALKKRFPNIQDSGKNDICYATTNRQNAVIDVARVAEAFIVVGSQNSSNSKRLVEVAVNAGCANSCLIDDKNDIDWTRYNNVSSVGISAGASAPELLVTDVIKAFGKRFNITVKTLVSAKEDILFKVPPQLREMV